MKNRLGEEIRRLRKRGRESQTDLALAIHADQSDVSRLECGRLALDAKAVTLIHRMALHYQEDWTAWLKMWAEDAGEFVLGGGA